MFEIRCLFCKRIHKSEWWDALEEEILRCRDDAPKWQRGDLDDFPEDTRPISVEAGAAAAIAAREEAASFNF